MFNIAAVLGISFSVAAWIASLLMAGTTVVAILTGMGFGAAIIAVILAYPKWMTRMQLAAW